MLKSAPEQLFCFDQGLSNGIGGVRLVGLSVGSRQLAGKYSGTGEEEIVHPVPRGELCQPARALNVRLTHRIDAIDLGDEPVHPESGRSVGAESVS